MSRDDVDQDTFVEAGFNLFLISEPCILTKFFQLTEKATIEVDENTCTDQSCQFILSGTSIL
jgi:hypothetical protein